MAYNKECVLIILDIRLNADESFKQKSIKCAAEILKDKICSGKKDYISFVLLGTERTYNDLNTNMCHDGYCNIIQYPHVQLPTWQLLINFFKFVNETATTKGEWLDALVIGMEMFKNTTEISKCQRKRIVLFYDFNASLNDYDQFDIIAENLLQEGISLVVVSHNIKYIDNPANGEPQAIFAETTKVQHQLDNEKYALRLVSSCNTVLSNFDETLRTVFKVENKRPWAWNATLCIGSKVKICVSGLIAIKDESNLKLTKCWGANDEHVVKEKKYYVLDNEVDMLDTDLIDAYMLGATPIPYDESLREIREQNEQGLQFLAFTKRKSIPVEYFCGDSLYWIVHRKGMQASAKKLDALVHAMNNLNMVMLCWKVYSAKFNNKKLVVLLPNEPHPNKPSSLSMVELSYHTQHHYWDFPSLATPKTACTTEQLLAIDNLIDSMDLMMETKDPTAALSQTPRETYLKELLPYNNLPHIYEQNVMDVLERKIISNACEDDEQFQEMLKDKNFVEIFWKLPEQIEQKAKSAARNVKKLFPLEKREPTTAAKVKNTATSVTVKTEQKVNIKSDYEPLEIVCVGEKTPADDFKRLLQHNVTVLADNTLRDSKYQDYALQIRTAITNLIAKGAKAGFDALAVADALRTYRQSCYEFNALADYNKWIRDVKQLIEDQKLFDFWQDVIVHYELGLCIVGNVSLEEKISLEQFYKIDGIDESEQTNTIAMSISQEQDELDDTSVDELLAQI